MNKILYLLNQLEEDLEYSLISKREALEILNGIDLSNINLEKYKKIKKLLKK